jgi:hypothetical protein
LTWIASDQTPWSYEIYENSTLVFSDTWNGSDIIYTFEASSIGMWNVTLVAYDAFDNAAVDVVMIEVYSPSDILIVVLGVLAVGIASLVLVVLWVKKK